MAAAAILKIHFNGHNSVAIAHIYTNWLRKKKTDVLGTEIPSNFISLKIQDGGRRPFLKHINRHNSAALQAIFNEFGTKIDTGKPRLALTSNFTSDKIQDGGGRHFENPL